MTTQITVAQLQRLIGTPAAPVVVDVCLDEDFAAYPYLIPTAMRWPHNDLHSIVSQLQGRHVVVICQKGLKLSEGAAAILRAEGITAEHLKGGMMAWQAAGAMQVCAGALPESINGHTLWVTRSRPKIDRIACPWLIRRFIDPCAKFLFVSGSQVKSVAQRFNATPFDVDNVLLGHQNDACTFDALLAHFGLNNEALSRLAQVVRAADTSRHELDEVAAGLHAVSVGLSRMYRDDLQQLDAGMPIYDALYRWARDAVDEAHDSSQYSAPGKRTS
ncbi:MAG: sulfurtransferase/chromate resistance protein [Pseudomonadota bacterium]